MADDQSSSAPARPIGAAAPMDHPRDPEALYPDDVPKPAESSTGDRSEALYPDDAPSAEMFRYTVGNGDAGLCTRSGTPRRPAATIVEAMLSSTTAMCH